MRSGANVAAGGRERLSAVVHGLLLVFTVVFAGALLNVIPRAALAAVLMQGGLNLCKPALLSSQVKLGWTQFLPFAITLAAVLALGRLKGVLVGITDGERVLIDGTGEYVDHDVKEVIAGFLEDAPRRNILVTVVGIELSMASVGGGH